MTTRVLHLSLSHGGGIITAMETYIQNSSFAEHFLIANVDESCAINFSDNVELKKVYNVNLNFNGLIAIYKAVREVKPTHIHLHSSHAGAIGRLLFPLFKNVIYTPHCYAFERTDVSWFVKKLFYTIEWCLSLKPTVVAGCSPREAELGNKLGLSSLLNTGGNVFLTNYSIPQEKWSNDALKYKTVVMVGRICAQKDPQFFIDTFIELQKLDNTIKFIWLGGGGEKEVSNLQEQGIECTGWLSKENLLDKLVNSSLYFHCAAWEGNPMSVLEAAAIQMPIVGRNISSLESIGIKTLKNTPKECAILITQFFNNNNKEVLDQFETVNTLCSVENQKAALNTLYKAS